MAWWWYGHSSSNRCPASKLSLPFIDWLLLRAATPPPAFLHLNIRRSQTHPHQHTYNPHTVMVMNRASSWLSVAALGAAALLVAVEEGQAFVLPQSRVLSGARPAMGPRTRGLVQAVQSMPPPTTTSTSSSAEKGPWSPTSWRNFTPRQMPVYDDDVSQATNGREERVIWSSTLTYVYIGLYSVTGGVEKGGAGAGQVLPFGLCGRMPATSRAPW